MTTKICTSTVAKRFELAHHSYRQQASVQMQMAEQLIEQLCAIANERAHRCHFDQVLEIGCGSGLLTEQFAKYCRANVLYLNDLYEDICHNVRPMPATYQYLIGDVQALTLPTGLDLVLSGAALQWIYPLDEMMTKIHRSLASEGMMAISTFGEQNLWQIRQLTGQGLTYHCMDELIQMANRLGFEVCYQQQQQMVRYFESPMAVLRHLQATGVTATGGAFRWSKGALAQFCDEYQAMATADGVPLTYHPIILIAKKR